MPDQVRPDKVEMVKDYIGRHIEQARLIRRHHLRRRRSRRRPVAAAAASSPPLPPCPPLSPCSSGRTLARAPSAARPSLAPPQSWGVPLLGVVPDLPFLGKVKPPSVTAV